MKALVMNGAVHQVVEDGATFPVHENLSWVDCDASVKAGYIYDGAIFTAPVVEPDSPPPTVDEVYDNTIQNSLFLKAVTLSLNDGTFPVGTNLSNAELKTIIKANM